MDEIFKQVNGYPDYEISNCGRVKTKSRMLRYTHAVTGQEHFRKSTERYLKEYQTVHGYKFVQLYLDKVSKNMNIHRLVALNFLDRTDDLTVVNHKDGNKHNNRVDNLEWCTDKYNHEHATSTGLMAKGSEIGTSVLNDKCIIAIKKLLSMGWNHRRIAELFEISRPNVCLINTGKIWKHIKPSKGGSTHA